MPRGRDQDVHWPSVLDVQGQVDHSPLCRCDHGVQVLGVMAVSCPSLRHLSIPSVNLSSNNCVGNPLKLIVNSFPVSQFPSFTSLEVKQIDAFSAASSAGGLEHLTGLDDLAHLTLSILNTKQTGRKLATVFAKLHKLRKVSVGVAGMFQGSPHISSATFLPNLVTNNLQLEVVELDMGIMVTSKNKVMLERRGVKLRQLWGLGYDSYDSTHGEEEEMEDR